MSQQTLEYLKVQMQQRSLWANWWIASAITGNAAKRKIMQGNHQLTREELIDDAMETAKRHIEEYGNLADAFANTEYEQ